MYESKSILNTELFAEQKSIQASATGSIEYCVRFCNNEFELEIPCETWSAYINFTSYNIKIVAGDISLHLLINNQIRFNTSSCVYIERFIKAYEKYKEENKI